MFPRSYVAMSRDVWLLPLMDGVTGIWGVEARDAAKYPTMHTGQPPMTKTYLAQKYQ